MAFLSTSPLRGTTGYAATSELGQEISIHVPLAGDDIAVIAIMRKVPPISIHVPLAGDDKRSVGSVANK